MQPLTRPQVLIMQYVFICYVSAPCECCTECQLQPGNRSCLVKRHIAQAGLSIVSQLRGNELRQSSQNPFIEGMHMSSQMVLKSTALLTSYYLYMRISKRHESAYTLDKKPNGNDTEAAPLTGTAHQCHFFPCHSKREEGWFILLPPLYTEELYYCLFKDNDIPQR